MAESMLCYPLRHYLTITRRFRSAHLGADFGRNGRIADNVVVTAVAGFGNTRYSNNQPLHFELRRGGCSKVYSVGPPDRLYVMSVVANPVVSRSRCRPSAFAPHRR